MTTDEARARIKRISSGGGLWRDHFPDSMKGEVARGCWDEALFAYGMEYGYLLAMHDVLEGGDSTVEPE